MAEEIIETVDQTFELSNNKQLSDLLRELSVLRDRGSFCDVVVEVQSRRYLAHKAVLSSTCEYFRTLFLDIPCCSMGPFVIDFLSMRTFEKVVNFIYKGQICANREEMRELSYAATDLGMECLEEACNSFNLEEELVVDPILEDRCNTQHFPSAEVLRALKDRPVIPPKPALTKLERDKLPLSKRYSIMNTHWPAEEYEEDDSDEDDSDEDDCDEAVGDSTTVDKSKPEPLEREGAAGEDEDTGETYGALDILYEGTVEQTEESIVYPHLGEPYSGYLDDLLTGVPCQACGDIVGESDDSVKEHARAAHLDVATMSCRVCGKTFRLLSNAEQHAVVHMGVTALHCPDCRKQFFSEERLGLHRGHGCGKKPGAPPPRGTKAAATKGRAAPSLASRLLPQSEAPCAPGAGGGGSSSAIKNVVWCKTCGEMVFKTMSALRTHARTHVETSSMLCKVCGQQSTFTSNLIKHALLHVGVLLYGCGKCGKRFLMRCRLIVHQRSCRGSGTARRAVSWGATATDGGACGGDR